MPKRERVACGPHLRASAPLERTAKSTGEGREGEDEANAAVHPNDGSRFLISPPGAGRSSSSLSIVFYRRQFPLYPEVAPTEAWDMLRLHLGLIVHQAALDLNLPIYAVAAAVSAFHAVFPGHFTKEELSSSPHVVTRCMAACLFLAGKASETNLKLREAVNCIDFLQWKLQQQSRLQSLAAENDSQKAHDEFFNSAETREFPDADEKRQFLGSFTVTSASQESKAEKQPIESAEQTNKEATTSVSAAGLEEEEGKNVDGGDKWGDADEKSSTRTANRGRKLTAVESQSEAGLAQKEDSSGRSAQSQNHSESARYRICGIAAFSRFSRYLKGYVPMGIREYWHVRQECLREEERLLQAIGFSLPLPYLYDVLLEAVILLLPTHQEAHLIWAITNDIAATPLLEQFSPPVLIATAALFAKKLLAVASSISSPENETVSYRKGKNIPSSIANTAPHHDVVTDSEPNNSLSDSSSEYDKGVSSIAADNSGTGVREKLCESLADSFLPHCKIELVESSLKMTLGNKKESNAEAQPENAGPQTTDPAETSAHAGGTFGGSAEKRDEPGDGMLEVLERLNPLLCSSPEYWTLCKSHERRALERGGSRWARAVPPAGSGWTVMCSPNSAAAADNYADSAVSGAAGPTKPFYCSAADLNASVYSPAALTPDDKITFALQGSVASEAMTEDQAERERLLREVQEDKRQQKLVYVQVGEACARLMEIYSLLLKSRGGVNTRSGPAD